MLKLGPGYGYGETVQRHEVDGLILTDCEYGPDQTTPAHAHQYAYLCVVMGGSYTEIFKHGSRMFEPFTLAFHPAEEVHRNHFHRGGGRIFSVEVSPLWVARLGLTANPLNCQTYYSGGSLVALGFKLYGEFQRMDAVSPLAIEGLMLEILADASRSLQRNSTRMPRWLEKTRELLHAHFSESHTLAKIAAEVGVHPVYLARAFRQYHSCTIGDYVRQLRIDYARRELSTSTRPLIEIALAAGFCSQSHFSTSFKRSIGVSPTKYRTAFRRPSSD